MNAKTVWGIALCLISPLCIGCTSNPGVVRGQSPAGPDPGIGGRLTEITHHATYEPGLSVHGGPYVPSGMEDCPPGAQVHDWSTWQPTHRHFYKYNHPRNLVYPQDNTPAAVVQYPYYTCKGPDDFFRDDQRQKHMY